MTSIFYNDKQMKQWRSRLLRKLLVFASFIIAILCIIAQRVLPDIMVTAAFIACAASMYWYGSFRCPVCHNRFFFDGRGAKNCWSNTCLHCGAEAPE